MCVVATVIRAMPRHQLQKYKLVLDAFWWRQSTGDFEQIEKYHSIASTERNRQMRPT